MFRTAGCAGRRKNCRARKSSPAIRTLPIALPHCATFFHTATISYASLERDAGKSKSGSRSILRYTKPPVRWERVSQTLLGGRHSALRKNGEANRRLLPTARNEELLIPALVIWRR
jgi:hypothetical protein